MFCPNCGKQIPDGSKLCPYCGTKIERIIPGNIQKAPRRSYKALILVLIVIVVLFSVFGYFKFIKPKIASNVNTGKPVTPLLSTPWPMFRYNAQHTGQSPYVGSQVNTLKWKYTIGDTVDSSPAIDSDGTVYVGSYDNNLYAINPNGTLKWKYTTGDIIVSSPAIGSDGTVYVGSHDNNLYAINPNGTLKWKYTTGRIIVSSPAIGSDGTVYVGSEDNNLYAINPNGTLKWKYTIGDTVDSSPAIGSDGTVYVGSCDNNLYAINPNGTLKWKYTTGHIIVSSPAIGSDGTVYVGSCDRNLYAINPDGTLKWKYTTNNAMISSPAIGSDGTVYVGPDTLYAINPNGTLKWKCEAYEDTFPLIYVVKGFFQTSPVIGSDGTVYVGSEDSNLYAINPDGTIKWKYTTGRRIVSSPAIGSDGTVYVGSEDNNLYAIGRQQIASNTNTGNSNNQTIINHIMKEAKFILEFKTGATVNLESVISDSNLPKPIKIGNYAVWTKSLSDYSPNDNSIAGFPKDLTNMISFKFAIDSSGNFYVGSFGGTDEDHLFLFTLGGTSNYSDFDGKTLAQAIYGTPKDRFLDLNIRNNFLGQILSDTYAQLYKDGDITSGPSNYYMLYSCPAILKNNTNKKVVILDSYIAHQQMDYFWYPSTQKTIDDARNKAWSPIANNIDQNTALSRSFKISYLNPSASYLKIYTYTDVGMHGDVTIYGLNNPPDYTSSGRNTFGNLWSITYDKDKNSYNVHEEECSWATVYLKGQYPNKVEMSDYTNWSYVEQDFSIAIFGDDINVSNPIEQPSHDDGNPLPHKLFILPGENGK